MPKSFVPLVEEWALVTDDENKNDEEEEWFTCWASPVESRATKPCFYGWTFGVPKQAPGGGSAIAYALHQLLWILKT